jgi:hypothetical protein
MSNGWRPSYARLTEFISKHPEIEIGEEVVRIPEGYRPRFYTLFDRIGANLLNESFPDMLPEAKRLSSSYDIAARKLSSQLKLEGISTSHGLQKFLQDPKGSLMAELFEPSFDLVKKRISAEAFEREASGKLKTSFETFYRQGYEKWVEISLAEILEPDRALRVPLPKLTYIQKIRYVQKIPGSAPLKRPVPPLEDVRGLSLEREIFPIFIAPDIIVRSAKLNGYAAMGSELADASWIASNASRRKKWDPLVSIKAKLGSARLWPDLCVYMSRKPEDIALIADSERMCRPDLIVECTEHGDQLQNDLRKAWLMHSVFTPKLGTFIVSRWPVPKGARQSIGEGIKLLTVGLDRSRLRPVVDSLAS